MELPNPVSCTISSTPFFFPPPSVSVCHSFRCDATSNNKAQSKFHMNVLYLWLINSVLMSFPMFTMCVVTYYQLKFLQKCVSSSGLTGHTEVVRVVFSPQEISLEELLKRFWENHDPTQGSSTLTLNTKSQEKKRGLPRGAQWCIRAEGGCPRMCMRCGAGGRSHGC